MNYYMLPWKIQICLIRRITLIKEHKRKIVRNIVLRSFGKTECLSVAKGKRKRNKSKQNKIMLYWIISSEFYDSNKHVDVYTFRSAHDM